MRATKSILACIDADILLLRCCSERWLSLITLDQRWLRGFFIVWRIFFLADVVVWGVELLECTIRPISAYVSKRIWLFTRAWSDLVCNVTHPIFGTIHEVADPGNRLITLDGNSWWGGWFLVVLEVMNAWKSPVVLFCTLVEQIVSKSSEVLVT